MPEKCGTLLSQAVSLLSAGRSSALPHLRAINGHVASIIASSVSGGQPPPVLPRQDAPAPAIQRGGVLGVSSFAFQVCQPERLSHRSILRCQLYSYSQCLKLASTTLTRAPRIHVKFVPPCC